MLSFGSPFAFFFLALPLISLYWGKNRKQSQSALNVPFFKQVSSHAKGSGFIKIPTWKLICSLLIWCLYVFALANPKWIGEPITQNLQTRNILLAIDVSGSMEIPDMMINHQAVDRLSAVKNIGEQFIAAREGDRMGVILFGSKAYLQTPLTFDRQTVASVLDDASIGLAGRMTALGDAIGLGIKHLVKYPEKSRILVILTDGSNNSGAVDPLTAAQIAAQKNIKIYTIGLGSEQITYNTPLGTQVINASSELDENSLKNIAATTKGQYFRAKDTNALHSIIQVINKLEPINAQKKLLHNEKSLYYWPLGLAILLSFFLSLVNLGLFSLTFKMVLKHE